MEPSSTLPTQESEEQMSEDNCHRPYDDDDDTCTSHTIGTTAARVSTQYRSTVSLAPPTTTTNTNRFNSLGRNDDGGHHIDDNSEQQLYLRRQWTSARLTNYHSYHSEPMLRLNSSSSSSSLASSATSSSSSSSSSSFVIHSTPNILTRTSSSSSSSSTSTAESMILETCRGGGGSYLSTTVEEKDNNDDDDGDEVGHQVDNNVVPIMSQLTSSFDGIQFQNSPCSAPRMASTTMATTTDINFSEKNDHTRSRPSSSSLSATTTLPKSTQLNNATDITVRLLQAHKERQKLLSYQPPSPSKFSSNRHKFKRSLSANTSAMSDTNVLLYSQSRRCTASQYHQQHNQSSSLINQTAATACRASFFDDQPTCSSIENAYNPHNVHHCNVSLDANTTVPARSQSSTSATFHHNHHHHPIIGGRQRHNSSMMTTVNMNTEFEIVDSTQRSQSLAELNVATNTNTTSPSRPTSRVTNITTTNNSSGCSPTTSCGGGGGGGVTSERSEQFNASTSWTLEHCETNLLVVYNRLISIIGWRPLIGYTPYSVRNHFITLFNWFYLTLIAILLLSGYIFQYAICFREDLTAAYDPVVIAAHHRTLYHPHGGGVYDDDKLDDNRTSPPAVAVNANIIINSTTKVPNYQSTTKSKLQNNEQPNNIIIISTTTNNLTTTFQQQQSQPNNQQQTTNDSQITMLIQNIFISLFVNLPQKVWQSFVQWYIRTVMKPYYPYQQQQQNNNDDNYSQYHQVMIVMNSDDDQNNGTIDNDDVLKSYNHHRIHLYRCTGGAVIYYIIPSVIHFLAYIAMIVDMRWPERDQFHNLVLCTYMLWTRIVGRVRATARFTRITTFWWCFALIIMALSTTSHLLHLFVFDQDTICMTFFHTTTFGEMFAEKCGCLALFALIDLFTIILFTTYGLQCEINIVFLQMNITAMREKRIDFHEFIQHTEGSKMSIDKLNRTHSLTVTTLMIYFSSRTVVVLMELFTTRQMLSPLAILALIQWVTLTLVPLIQAARLTQACTGIRFIGHELRARPFCYKLTGVQDLDSLLTYTATLHLNARLAWIPVRPSCVATILVGSVFLFLILGQANVIKV